MYVNTLKKFQGHYFVTFVHFAPLSGRDRRLLSVIKSPFSEFNFLFLVEL